MLIEIVGLLLVFAFVLLLSYYTARIIGKKYTGRTINKNMKIVETLPLGLDRCLYLILVGKKYFLFFSNKKGMELVSEIEVEETPEGVLQEESGTTNIFDFKKIFETYSGLSPKKPKEVSLFDEQETEQKATGVLGSLKRLQKINSKKQ